MSSYKGVLDLFSFSQIISQPMRVTSTSISTIDHILTNVGDLIQNSGVLDIAFSDHLVTFCTRHSVKGFSFGPIVRKIWSFRTYSKQIFIAELSKMNWSSVLLADNVDYAIMEFNRLFRSVIDKVAPFRDVRVRNRSSLWMNSRILSMRAIREIEMTLIYTGNIVA